VVRRPERAVSDDYLEAGPAASENATNPDGTPNIDAVLRSLHEDPHQMPDLVKVTINFQRALGTLHGVWRILQPRFFLT
jgi:hypothetical protein